jgi:hypothetical protein
MSKASQAEETRNFAHSHAGGVASVEVSAPSTSEPDEAQRTARRPQWRDELSDDRDELDVFTVLRLLKSQKALVDRLVKQTTIRLAAGGPAPDRWQLGPAAVCRRFTSTSDGGRIQRRRSLQ